MCHCRSGARIAAQALGLLLAACGGGGGGADAPPSAFTAGLACRDSTSSPGASTASQPTADADAPGRCPVARAMTLAHTPAMLQAMAPSAAEGAATLAFGDATAGPSETMPESGCAESSARIGQAGGGGAVTAAPMSAPSEVACRSGGTGRVAQAYVLQDLGPGAAYDINDDGDAIGITTGANPVVWKDGVAVPLAVLPGAPSGQTIPNEINDMGHIAGEAWSPSTRWRAVLWTAPASIQDLGMLPGGSVSYGSYGEGLNNRDQLTGHSGSADGTLAFLWTPQQGMESVHTLPGNISFAYDVNDRGEVVGQVVVGMGGPPFNETIADAFVWRRGQGMTRLGQLVAGKSAAAWSINERGHASGWAYGTSPQGGTVYRAVFWPQPGTVVDMGNNRPDYENSARANDLNNHDEAVGISFTPSAFQSTFVWHPTTGMRDLGPLSAGIPAQGYLWYAHGINDRGQIVGEYATNNQMRAFVLHPLVPNHAQVASVVAESGTVNAGSAASVQRSDDSHLVVAGSVAAPARVRSEGTAPYTNVTSLVFKLEAKASSAGLLLVAELFDFAAGQWVVVGASRPATSDEVFTFAPDQPNRFIQPGTRTVLARVAAHSLQRNVRGWQLSIDRAEWTFRRNP